MKIINGYIKARDVLHARLVIKTFKNDIFRKGSVNPKDVKYVFNLIALSS